MNKKAKKKLVFQHDSSDCGPACLLSIIRYLGGNQSIENLRNWSGTTSSGTTLLGIIQCANMIGLNAEGFEADVESLKKLETLAILHTIQENDYEHYVVYYGYDNIRMVFQIGDPALGYQEWTESSLVNYWRKKILLQIIPNDSFKLRSVIQREKWEWFIHILKEDKVLLVISIFLGILIAILALSTAIFTQQLIDVIIPKQQLQKLYVSLGLLLILLTAKVVIIYLRQYVLLKQSKGFNERITCSFIHKLIKLPLLFFDTRKIGDLVTRLNDAMRIQRSIAFLANFFIIDLLFIIISTLYLFSYHYLIAISTLIPLPILGFLAWRYHEPLIEANQNVMISNAINESNYIDTMNGISVIKEMNKQNQYESKMINTFSIFQSKNLDLGVKGNQFNFWVEGIASLLIISLLGVTTYLTLNNEMKIGEMMAVLSIGLGLFPSIIRLVLTNLQIQEAKVAFDRMYEFSSINPERETDFFNILPFKYIHQIELKNITYRYLGRTPILKNVNIHLKKGEITLLTGNSGCGKTTLLKLLQASYDYESGFFLINNQFNIQDIPISDIRNLIASVPQEIKLFNTTILENIALEFNEKSLERVIKLCDDLKLLEVFSEFPQGLLSQIGEDKISLSGGQKQIVGLLRALYKEPQVLLLDEITSALDINLENKILLILQELKKDMIILLISHNSNLDKIADQKILLDKGITYRL